jgi:hypothetical protein
LSVGKLILAVLHAIMLFVAIINKPVIGLETIGIRQFGIFGELKDMYKFNPDGMI